MSRIVTDTMEKVLLSYFDYVEADINNCPDSLWEQKYDGNYYWQQVYHVLGGTIGMLDRIPLPELPIPLGYAFLRPAVAAQFGFPIDGEYKGAHTKEIMLKLLDLTKEHIRGYFQTFDDTTLFGEIDVYGQKTTLFERVENVTAHILYHIGIFDANLRANGAEGVM